MKKTAIIMSLLIILLMSSCKSAIVRNGGVVEHGVALPTANIEQAYANESIVYTTKTGSKYHEPGCRHLKSQIPISLEQAESQGMEPCNTCHK